MAERYRRFAKSGITTETTVYTAPHDGETPAGAAESVIIGFLIANTSSSAAEVTVKLVGVDEDGADVSVKIADTIPLPANSTVDIVPGKLVLHHALDDTSPTPVLTADVLKLTATQTCDVTISVVERV